MKKTGFVGWRGMVGSVLMDRMREENDFAQIEPIFFTTSQAGQAAPDVGVETPLLQSAFDIDALDPAFAPGTGTPVWGGLASWQSAAILRDLAGINIMGGDVVEVSPPFDTTGATAIAGAHIATEILCLLGHRMRTT